MRELTALNAVRKFRVAAWVWGSVTGMKRGPSPPSSVRVWTDLAGGLGVLHGRVGVGECDGCAAVRGCRGVFAARGFGVGRVCGRVVAGCSGVWVSY